jgi:transcriptional regulator with XRE-family HTH domain
VREAVQRLTRDLRGARRTSGLSLRDVGDATHTSHQQVHRFERGALRHVDLEDLGAWCAVVGLDLGLRAFPAGDPVRDRGQQALLERLHERLHPSLRWATEVPLPIPGDLRAWDAEVAGDGWRAFVDAESVLDDLQALDRRLALKARDGQAALVLLVVADTKRNRTALRGAPTAFGHLNRSSRTVLRALARGQGPPGSAILVL